MKWVLELGWLFFLLFLFYHFWQRRKVLVDAQSWLKVKGQVTSCTFVEVKHTIWPEIEYQYQILEKDLVGHYLFLDTIHNNPNSKYSRSVAYKVAVAFKNETEIDVYYNPNQPEQSVLDVTIPKKLNIILGAIAGLLVLQVLSILYHLAQLLHLLV